MVNASPDFDAVVIGAGVSGMYMLKALRNRRVDEAGETVGGTWYWNRYLGARCDSEAYVYCFTWDKEPAERARPPCGGGPDEPLTSEVG
jgi:cyclohexanone monooxygenase